MDDHTPERLAELLAQLPPAPAAWVRAARAIGTTTTNEGASTMPDENERIAVNEPAEVEGHFRAARTEDEPEEHGAEGKRPRPRDDEDGPEVEGHKKAI